MFNWIRMLHLKFRNWKQRRQPTNHIIFINGKLINYNQEVIVMRRFSKTEAQDIARQCVDLGDKVEVFKKVDIKIKIKLG